MLCESAAESNCTDRPMERPAALVLPQKQYSPGYHDVGASTHSGAMKKPIRKSTSHDLSTSKSVMTLQTLLHSQRHNDLSGGGMAGGTLINENHPNFTLIYDMLTGIRTTVSRCEAKPRRELTLDDFKASHKYAFDTTGTELTPYSKYAFKFKDYAPWVFRHLRERFNIDAADYLLTLTGKYTLSEMGSPGKSGSFFYYSEDYRFIIKTLKPTELAVLKRILKNYYQHVRDYPNTLLSRFYGLHRVKIPNHHWKIHFVIMGNIFPPTAKLEVVYDLKGSLQGRSAKHDDLERLDAATANRLSPKSTTTINHTSSVSHNTSNPKETSSSSTFMRRSTAAAAINNNNHSAQERTMPAKKDAFSLPPSPPTASKHIKPSNDRGSTPAASPAVPILKDRDILRSKTKLYLGPMKKKFLMDQIQHDTAFLARMNIMDYSLLVGISRQSHRHEDASAASKSMAMRMRSLQSLPQLEESSLEDAESIRMHGKQKEKGKANHVSEDDVDENEGNDRDSKDPSTTRKRSSLVGPLLTREALLRTLVHLKVLKKDEEQVLMSSNDLTMPKEKKQCLFFHDDGGYRATSHQESLLPEVYYLGIIDIFTPYNLVKRLETFFKRFAVKNIGAISAVPPTWYARRFQSFIEDNISVVTENTFVREREERDRACLMRLEKRKNKKHKNHQDLISSKQTDNKKGHVEKRDNVS